MSVRLPSALAGIFTIGALFALVRILFANVPLALLSSFILSIMPWHIHISRVESESNVAILFVTLATILFLKALTYKRTIFLTMSGILFALTYYTYHGNHIFTTLFALGLIFLYRDEVFKIPKWFVSAGVSAALVTIILSFTLLSANKTKISGIGIFGDPTIVHTKIELVRLSHTNPSALFSRLLHNKPIYALTTITQNYLKSYSPEFLFYHRRQKSCSQHTRVWKYASYRKHLSSLGSMLCPDPNKKKNIYSFFGGFLQPVSRQQLPKMPHTPIACLPWFPH